MKGSITKRLRNAKRRMERRLDGPRADRGKPMFAAANVRVELADKVRGMGTGGIGVVHRLAEQIGLVEAINRRLHLLKIHLPYHESDHVLNVAYNALCDGTRLEDIELRRNDEVFLDALGTQRIPDPTTAGDFCRRFAESDIRSLMQAVDDARLKVWAKQPKKFFDQWCTRTMRSQLEPMKKVARTLRNHRELLLNWFRAKGGLSSGVVEGFNNKEN